MKQETKPLIDLDNLGWALAAYSAVASLVCFWRLGAAGVIHMEGMVADGARHMVASGDWLVPRVYGEIYTFKPALAYWLGAFAYAITDAPSEWLLRLPFAASVFALGLGVFMLIRRLIGNRIAALSAIATVSGVIVGEKVKLAEFDGIVTAGIGIAIAAACYNLAARKPRGGVWLLGYLGLTIGFLAKGVPALMLYPPGVLAAGWATKRFRRLLDWRHIVAALMFLALTGGYLLGAYRSAGPAAFEQPLAESKLRGFGWIEPKLDEEAKAEKLQKGEFFLAGDEAEVASDPLATLGRTLAKPFLVLAAFLPWSLLVPSTLSRVSLREADSPTAVLTRAAAAFLLAGVLLFMAVPTHAMRYYMPLCVPVGVLAGIRAGGDFFAGKHSGRMLKICAAVAIGVSAVTAAAAFALETPPVTVAQRAVIALVGLLALGASVAVIRKRPRDAVAALLVLVVVCLSVLGNLGILVQKEAKRNLRQEARELAAALPDEAPVWVLGPSDLAGKNSSLLFYLRRPVLAFRLAGPFPPDGSYCIIPSDRLEELARAPRFEFDPVIRVEHPWRDFLLGPCSERAPPTSQP